MMNFFLAVQVIIVVCLILVILSQRSESGMGGLAGGGGQAQFFAGRPEANMMTRLTTILAALFFISSISFGFVFGTYEDIIQGSGIPQQNEIIIEE